VLVALLLLFGCGPTVVPRGENLEEGLRQIREADGAPLYYAGREFEGLPLTHVEFEPPGRGLFGYGTCEIPAGTDGGCAPPAQVQIFPFDPAAWRAAFGCHRLPSLRGVPTVRHDGLVLFTGRTVVKIYASSPAQDRRVALALRPVGNEGAAPSSLPPPPREVRELVAAVCG